MTYYKVKPEYDQKRRKDGSILIMNELYTEKEVERFGIPAKYLERVQVKKSQIYFFFGARFDGTKDNGHFAEV